ncbi:MAG: hypothetical protein IJ877_03225 [Candidatus Gastranaerophilales bacterium]|nr:hypothetical protein [Candidatus Gastranaerophilales bacterium]
MPIKAFYFVNKSSDDNNCKKRANSMLKRLQAKQNSKIADLNNDDDACEMVQKYKEKRNPKNIKRSHVAILPCYIDMQTDKEDVCYLPNGAKIEFVKSFYEDEEADEYLPDGTPIKRFRLDDVHYEYLPDGTRIEIVKSFFDED